MNDRTSTYLLTHAGLVVGAILLAVWPWLASAEPVSAPSGHGFVNAGASLPDGCGTPPDPGRSAFDVRGQAQRFPSVMDAAATSATRQPHEVPSSPPAGPLPARAHESSLLVNAR